MGGYRRRCPDCGYLGTRCLLASACPASTSCARQWCGGQVEAARERILDRGASLFECDIREELIERPSRCRIPRDSERLIHRQKDVADPITFANAQDPTDMRRAPHETLAHPHHLDPVVDVDAVPTWTVFTWQLAYHGGSAQRLERFAQNA